MVEPVTKPPVIFLMGPTASGKTDMAMALSDRLPVELVSVDSALVYRGLDIGSAKPSAEELREYPHRLIDIRDPAEPYSAADFYADANREIESIAAAGNIPLLVGGTMMYFKALLDGLAEMPAANEAIRAEIEALAAARGWPAVHEELAKVDPESAEKIHPNHSQRLSRALEVFRATGNKLSELQRQQGESEFLKAYQPIQFAIAPNDRAVLHERIALRYRKMLSEGFIDEVEGLRGRGDLNKDLPAIRAVGYRQVWEYLDGDCDYDTMVDKGVAATRQLAKRQLTWLRGWNDLKWLKTDGLMLESVKKTELLEEIVNYLPDLDL